MTLRTILLLQDTLQEKWMTPFKDKIALDFFIAAQLCLFILFSATNI